MIRRIVKMKFATENVEQFQKIYSNNSGKIRSFEGCLKVELLQDKSDPSVFFTYSIWNSEKDLNNYRESVLFTQVWDAVKILFNDKPLAWTLNEVMF